MNYNAFENLRDDADYRTQEHMERTFRSAVVEHEGGPRTFNEHMDPKFVSCSWEKRGLVVWYDLRPWMLNQSGIVHGGIIAASCDIAMGMLSRYMMAAEGCVTVQMQLQYLRPIPDGPGFFVRAELDKEGRNLFFLHARVYRGTSADDWKNSSADAKSLVATASAEFM
jgi:acyl-coenzyme A thioesterase PaaI-like protein